MKTAGKCVHCGTLVIWLGRWVHVLDGEHPLSSVCGTPEKGGE